MRCSHAFCPPRATKTCRAAISWSRLDPNERARILWKAGELVASKVEDLALLEVGRHDDRKGHQQAGVAWDGAALQVAQDAFGRIAPHRTAAQDEDPVAEAAGLVEIAVDLVERGSYADAERKLGRAVEADPGNVDAALLLARVDEHGSRAPECVGESDVAGQHAHLAGQVAQEVAFGATEPFAGCAMSDE